MSGTVFKTVQHQPGAILVGTPPYAVVKALPLVARLGGCEGVINFNILNLGQLKNLGSLIR